MAVQEEACRQQRTGFSRFMDKLEDTQNEPDGRMIPIHRVGIRDLNHPIQFQDGEDEPQSTIARVGMSVALSPDVRGTHMSRFVTLLSEEAEAISVAGLPKVLDTMARRLESAAATLRLEFPFFITKEAPASKATGKMDYTVLLEGVQEDGETTIHLGVRVPVTTLCPCSRNISERGAHNQRGEVVLTIAGDEGLPSVQELIRLVEACASSELYSVLKRPDEKVVTEQAYDNPVFVEDLVRNVAMRMRDMPGIKGYRIEGENFESIHNHNAFAVVVGG